VLLLALAGCDHAVEKTPAATAPVVRESTLGPVSLTVTAATGQIAVGEPLELRIEVVAEPLVEVTMPDSGEAFGPFAIRSRRHQPDIPDPDGEHRRWIDSYTLETFDSGDLEIPAFTVAFTDRRNEAATGAIESSISAGPIPIAVRSMIEGEFDPMQVRDIKGAAELDLPGPARWVWWTIAAALLLAATAALLVARRWRRGRAAPATPPPPPHRWALDALDRLESRQLLDRGLVHEFYVELSGIVREYLERRFGLRAPERTTDEFLRELGASASLLDEHKLLLAAFLRAADMVKFALVRPRAQESSEALQSARRLVHQTSPGDSEARESTGNPQAPESPGSLAAPAHAGQETNPAARPAAAAHSGGGRS
jgi:hypothetical protein